MKLDEMKTVTDVLKELNESYEDLLQAVKGTTEKAKITKQLWRHGKKPILIKLGLALIVFPEPAISDVLGTLLIAAGTIQEGIRRRVFYIEDVPKTFQGLLKDLQTAKDSL